ncbi:hypothetical protein CR970_04245 [Candidatus Saccharibacteria bacterium]|nr:MAG: hypothetical protein CR970_04245 [Candidatus Saccharibacteria bacterium]
MTYGKGAVPVVGGIAALPNTGDNRVLFAVAAGLLVSGVIVMIAAAVVARKGRAATN